MAFHYIMALTDFLLEAKIKKGVLQGAPRSDCSEPFALKKKNPHSDYTSVNLLRLIGENGFKLAAELEQICFHSEGPLSLSSSDP